MSLDVVDDSSDVVGVTCSCIEVSLEIIRVADSNIVITIEGIVATVCLVVEA